MIFFSVGLFFTLSPVSTAEKIASDDRDALFSSVLCPEPTVTGVMTITWVKGDTPEDFFCFGDSLEVEISGAAFLPTSLSRTLFSQKMKNKEKLVSICYSS